MEERSKSDNLMHAEADLAAAAAVLKDCQDKQAAIAGEMETARGELERLEGLPELTVKEALAQENTRRKVRRLQGDLDVAAEAVESAAVSVAAAERKHAAAKLGDLDAELADLDAEYVADVRGTEKRFREKRAVIFGKLREAHELNCSLVPGAHWTHRGALAGIPAEHMFPLEAAQETLQRTWAIDRSRTTGSPERPA